MLSDIFEYGIHERIQQAMRADGVWFERVQKKGPYGYQWGKWKPCGGKSERAWGNPYAGKARLPKEAA